MAVACKQSGCTGSIEEGYCNACGLAPVGGSADTAKATETSSSKTSSGRTGSGRTPSTRSARSTRSGRTGSVRTGSSNRTRGMAGRPLARAPLPPQDPLQALVAGTVPERKRFCSNCDSSLKREAGFCAKCGQEYSFKPTLSPGDMVAGKYEIKGTIAFGGLGWIYLALDSVLNRWVTLKGLLNSKDPKMLEVAVQEREYLAAVKHPNIVGIYDFVTQGTEGFIVMEYVNGKTLMNLRKESGGPLPVPEAISYIVEILPAFQYLDEAGMVYCDFKPDNVMVEEETVKLIDLGAVRRADDPSGDIYGSKGYTAPEAGSSPSALSDLYSVARALAVLVASFDFQGKYEHSLPPPEECDVFKAHEALYRLLKKATREKPEDRFQSAAELSDQLVGVLHEIAGKTNDLGRVESALFDPDSDREIESGDAKHVSDGIPRLKVDKDDAAASVIMAAGAIGDPERRLKMFTRALGQFPDSLELKMRVTDELVKLARFDEANSKIAEIQRVYPKDWRLAWYNGRALLAQGRTAETLAAFQSIVDELPGELAPKQALGRAFEAVGDMESAVRYYDAVSKADESFVNASLGLARCLEKKKDRAGAAEAYRRVPQASNRFPQAQTALARMLLADPSSADDLAAASAAVASLEGIVEGLPAHRLRAELLTAAARHAADGVIASAQILGLAWDEQSLRLGAEKELRTCARIVDTEEERFRFVDEANAIRPITLM